MRGYTQDALALFFYGLFGGVVRKNFSDYCEGGASAIESDLSRPDVSVRVEITGLRGARLDVQQAEAGASESTVAGAPIKFEVSARLEEKERRSGKIVVLFFLTVGTKPSVVKFELEGYATMTGRDDDLVKMLEVDPKTGVPLVFHRVYQHLFMAIYLLADLMGTIYPPPDLLFSTKQSTPSDSTVTEMPVQSAQKVTAGSPREEEKTISAEKG